MKTNKFKIIFFTALISFLSLAGFFTYAEEAKLDNEIFLEKIVVTPSRIEQCYTDSTRNVEVITSKDIQNSQAKDISDVLDDLSSVNINKYGGLGASKTMKMRGSTAEQVLIMVDGRVVNSPRDGQVDLSTIPLSNIDRIEVLHGPASSLYGSSAMGGVVNIITKNPPGEGFKTDLYSSFGTFRTYIERMTHGGNVSNLGYLISADYESTVGFRDNSRFNSRDFNTKFNYKLNDNNKVVLTTGFLKSNGGSPGPVNSPDTDDKQRQLKNSIDLDWQFDIDDSISIKAKAYNTYDRLEFLENEAGSIWDTAQNKDTHTTKVKGGDFQLCRKFFDFYQLLAGFDYVSNLNDSTTAAKHKYNVRAWFFDNQFDLMNRRLKFNLGARLDDYSNFGFQASPSFNFLYKFTEDNRIHGAISRSFRAPTFNDLYWPDQGWVKGNPNLRPEKGTTAELGFNAKINKYLLAGLTYFHSEYDNLINWVEESWVWSPKNIGRAKIDGIEFSGTCFALGNIELEAGYTFLLSKDKKTKKFLIYQPENKANWSLKYNDRKGFIAELKGEFTGTRFHDAENSIKVKRFYVFGLNVSKKFQNGATFFVSMDNMLARDYVMVRDYPVPGFSITNGIKFEF